LARNPRNVWDMTASKLKGLALRGPQLDNKFPEFE
jgi:hypothetical protein